jgi:FkbM family methyltransferase
MLKTSQAETIFDLGFCDGADTAYYLAKGFRVVAVEANPALAAAGQNRFAAEIADGRLTLLNIGIGSEHATLPFYVNEANAHWSSFEISYGCRDGTPFHIVYVSCQTIGELLETYGCPYYMKIDIEGVDKIVLSDMVKRTERPTLISVEEFGPATFDALAALGYTRFRVVPQNHRPRNRLPLWRREGRYVPWWTFDLHSSGPFGRDLRLPWRSAADARRDYDALLAAERANSVREWWDIHAAQPI